MKKLVVLIASLSTAAAAMGGITWNYSLQANLALVNGVPSPLVPPITVSGSFETTGDYGTAGEVTVGNLLSVTLAPIGAPPAPIGDLIVGTSAVPDVGKIQYDGGTGGTITTTIVWDQTGPNASPPPLNYREALQLSPSGIGSISGYAQATTDGASVAAILDVTSGSLVLTAIPEPHEYALLAGIGLLGLAAYRRIRA